MKDYKLSEIKAICQKEQGNCRECELYDNSSFAGRCSVVGYVEYYYESPLYWKIDEEEQDTETEYYTLEQMQAMSPQYIEAHWNKVQMSLQHIKEEQYDD